MLDSHPKGRITPNEALKHAFFDSNEMTPLNNSPLYVSL